MSTGKHNKLKSASVRRVKGNSSRAFIRSIIRHGRWRGHKITHAEHLRGKSVNATPLHRRKR